MSVDSVHRLVEPLVHDDRFGRDITPPTLPEPTSMSKSMADGHCISKDSIMFYANRYIFTDSEYENDVTVSHEVMKYQPTNQYAVGRSLHAENQLC